MNNTVNVEKKEIYDSRAGSAGGAADNQNGDKWGESLQSVFELALENQGPERTAKLLEKFATQVRAAPRPSAGATTPYVNTIPVGQQPASPIFSRRSIPTADGRSFILSVTVTGTISLTTTTP